MEILIHQPRFACRFQTTLMLLGLMIGVWGAAAPSAHAADIKTRNVVLIVSDGLRWQEIFHGADDRLINKEFGGVKNTNNLLKEFGGASPEERRKKLFPFLWGEMQNRGQILGNPDRGSVIEVTNGLKFSYPGYNEMTSGLGDARISSNSKIPNPNTNVFEWLSLQSGFQKKVAIFGSWDVFPYIFNCDRSRLPIWPAWEPRFATLEIKVPHLVSELKQDTTPLWEDLTQDALLYHAASAYVQSARPRVLFLGFGETDEWAHAGRYDLYLHAAHHVDAFVRRLWDQMQAMEQYRGRTTFLITADHGRGPGLTSWKDHGARIEGAEAIWVAAIGPDLEPRGECSNTPRYTQGQIAATVGALLGRDFHNAHPQTAPPIQQLLRPSR